MVRRLSSSTQTGFAGWVWQKPTVGWLLLVSCLFLLFTTDHSRAENKEPACKSLMRETGIVRDINEFGDILLHSGQYLSIADVQFLREPQQRILDTKLLKKLRTLLSERSISFVTLAKEDRFGRSPSYIWADGESGQEMLLQELLVRERNVALSPLPIEKMLWCGHRPLLQHLLATANDHEKNTLYKFDRLKRYLYGANDGVLWQKEGEFAIVTGVVQTTHRSRNAANLNFGDNWKNDFTARLSPKSRVIVEMEYGPLEEMVGRRIRVRGILDLYNGPMIAVEHPEQLEFLAK